MKSVAPQATATDLSVERKPGATPSRIPFTIWGSVNCMGETGFEQLYSAFHKSTAPAARAATVKRETKETKVEVSINLDGTGVCSSSSQIPFLDHMLDVRLPFSPAHM